MANPLNRKGPSAAATEVVAAPPAGWDPEMEKPDSRAFGQPAEQQGVPLSQSTRREEQPKVAEREKAAAAAVPGTEYWLP